MKPYITIMVLILLATRVIAEEIPNDFLKSDNQVWQTYFKRYLAFPKSCLTVESFLECLNGPHIFAKGADYDRSDFRTNMISLSGTKLLPREALWELKQQTGCKIEISDRCYGTLNIFFGKKD